MYKYLQSLEKFGVNLGLDRIKLLLEMLDNPHLKFKSIHVAGTNGKGSTCAMIASILIAAGYKVGLYTSPHLFDYRERIKVNDRNISRVDFLKGMRKVKRIAESIKREIGQPTVFEVLTAIAFWYFAQKKVDYAVVEVGLGGRLDATNVIVPLVSVITNIDYEHTNFLGKKITHIAREKAGIIKPGIPVVTAENKSEVLRVFKYLAEKKGCFLIKVGPVERKMCIGLTGKHQKFNAACAISAIRLAGIKVAFRNIKEGLKKVNWPGRFQIISKKPLTIVDGAHNPAGIRVLVNTLKQYYPNRKFVFIFGAQQDKDFTAMLNLIKPLARKILITHSSHQNAAYKDSISPAEALKLSDSEDRVVTGSLYLVADVLKMCYDRPLLR